MEKLEYFGEARGVTITVLVDNRADLLVKSTESVKRFTEKPLLAEHGFAALVDLEDARLRILWDAGIGKVALLENARRMKIDLATVDKIALSHGHRDHYAAMTAVLTAVAGPPAARQWDKEASVEEMRKWADGRRVPVIAHPAAFRERWGLGKDGRKYGPHIVPRQEWEAAGAEIVLSEGPCQLGPGCWTTGAIPRQSYEKSGTHKSMAYWDGRGFVRDYVEDDQSLVINLQGKGLVVLSGCAHSGIINTIDYAREISGVDQVWAILGGFHLASAKDEEIQRTIEDIKRAGPAMVVPSHCTGFKAISAFSRQMPEEFVLGAVGTQYRF